ncbi:MAG: hypothetical protein PHW10_05980 [Candidatus Peribacteraceae bacterium]|nr:hypothetical protein [Candidatus Peribacteraceae bacterium]
MLGALETRGVHESDLSGVCGSPAFADCVAAYVRSQAQPLVETPSQQHAHAIMGDHFFGPEEVHRLCGAPFGGESLRQLDCVPFREGTLLECRDTHVLFAGFPFSIRRMHARRRSFFRPLENARFDSFVRDERVDLRWYLMRRTFTPLEQTFDEQRLSLRGFEEVPLACEVAFMGLLYRLSQRRNLFRDIRILCGDIVRDSGHDGLCRTFIQGDDRGISFGKICPRSDRSRSAIAVARKESGSCS